MTLLRCCCCCHCCWRSTEVEVLLNQIIRQEPLLSEKRKPQVPSSRRPLAAGLSARPFRWMRSEFC